MQGFEPRTTCLRSKHSNQTELHPGDQGMYVDYVLTYRGLKLVITGCHTFLNTQNYTLVTKIGQEILL